jgi:hypothetical protein
MFRHFSEQLIHRSYKNYSCIARKISSLSQTIKLQVAIAVIRAACTSMDPKLEKFQITYNFDLDLQEKLM